MHNEIIKKALENIDNESIINTSFREINENKKELFRNIQLEHEYTRDYLKKLKDYRYCEDIDTIFIGRFIRWIPLDKEYISLKHGAFIVNINESDDSILLKCKLGRYVFDVNFSKSVVFQKLTDQEIVLLNIINYL